MNFFQTQFAMKSILSKTKPATQRIGSSDSAARMPRKRRARKSGRRFGAAAVEFAVCLPLIVLVVIGSIEGASLLFLRQALVQSAYEGVKVAIKEDSNNSFVDNIARAVTDGRSLSGVGVETTPADVSSVPRGELITVRITAPVKGNTLIPGGVFTLNQISAQAVMVKE